MQRSAFQLEVWCFLGFVGIAALLGLLCGNTLLGLVFGLSLYSLRFFYQSYCLAQWVYSARLSRLDTDQLASLWGDIAEDVRFMLGRHDKEKLRLQAVVVRVQEMTAALIDGVVLIDKRGNMEWWNQAAGHLLGFREVDQGHKLTNLIRHPQFVAYFDQRDYSRPLELASSRRQDQQLQLQVHSFGQGERLVVVRDITHVFKLEQMRKDFVANVSHELRTPLTVLRGYLETLIDSDELPRQWAGPCRQMEQQTQRMAQLIQDLIALSKLETDERERVHDKVRLSSLIQSVVQDAQALSGGNRHQFVVTGDSTISLRGNEGELRSAFSNIVYNATNYSAANAIIAISFERKADGVEVVVKDNGIGIDPKHLPRLTERFYRVDPSRSVLSGGTGLGLAIVKHVLLRHDADLRINSMLGKGTTVYCVFPAEAVVSAMDEPQDV